MAAEDASAVPLRTARLRAGALVLDLPRYLVALAAGSRGYLGCCNREDLLQPAPAGAPGFRCDWSWTRDLHAPKVFPWLGRRLMARALSDRPIELAGAPAGTGREPEVSFVIGHRGIARESLLHATLASIAAQRGVAVEAIVVEQSAARDIGERLPTWVRYVHTAVEPDAPYNRSWAFNVGARHARGRMLVLHDNDLLVPTSYAGCLLEHALAGAEVVNLKRFIFYLSERDSAHVRSSGVLRAVAPESVMENALGGGSLGVLAQTYDRLGGMDEGFVGWGGEDNEFWERCALVRRWEHGYLSLVHQWHESQPRKGGDATIPTIARQRRIAAIDPAERVRRLAAAGRGGTVPRVEDPFERELCEA